MSLDWYQEIYASDEITQGDLISECLLPRPSAGFYEDLLSNNGEPAEEIDIQQADVVVLSQACDIENDKIDSIIVCPYWDVAYFAQKNQNYAGRDRIESIRQGKEPPYHVIDRYQSNDISIGFQIVDFHQIYSVPKDYLQQLASRKTVRLRLNPPYREHLSQAFARYFMRVGLPSDIDRNQFREAAKRRV
jgi:hypothetical protein